MVHELRGEPLLKGTEAHDSCDTLGPVSTGWEVDYVARLAAAMHMAVRRRLGCAQASAVSPD